MQLYQDVYGSEEMMPGMDLWVGAVALVVAKMESAKIF